MFSTRELLIMFPQPLAIILASTLLWAALTVSMLEVGIPATLMGLGILVLAALAFGRVR